VALPTPRSLTPSKAEAFRSCPLAFRFSVIERRPEPATAATAVGTIVHRALEGLFWRHPPEHRTAEAAHCELAAAWQAAADDPELADVPLTGPEGQALRQQADTLIDGYLALEDPRRVADVAVEVTVEADVAGVHLRGILDRLDRADDGTLVVVDYKTGRVPPPQAEQARLAGVHLYALLCQHVLGQRPARVRLLYLSGPVAIEAVPTEAGLRALERRTSALWQAIERACATEDFRPRASALCRWCAFQALCPLQHGPSAVTEAHAPTAPTVTTLALRRAAAPTPIPGAPPATSPTTVSVGPASTPASTTSSGATAPMSTAGPTPPPTPTSSALGR
jgi:putative RecB family exonuclease